VTNSIIERIRLFVDSTFTTTVMNSVSYYYNVESDTHVMSCLKTVLRQFYTQYLFSSASVCSNLVISFRALTSQAAQSLVTGLVKGKWQILTSYRIETPEPIDIKFGTGDYVRETTPCTKFGAKLSTGTSEQIGEI